MHELIPFNQFEKKKNKNCFSLAASTLPAHNIDFDFTAQPNTLEGWGMGALVSQAQDIKLNVLQGPTPVT